MASQTQMTEPRSAENVLALLEKAEKDEQGLPPVHRWQPDHQADIDIRIARDGRWYHEGSVIRREAMVRVFSTILRREGDDYFLVTPAEKLRIVVEDAPFVAVALEQVVDRGVAKLVFTTNVGATVVADARHPLRVETDPATGEPSPYLRVRDNLEALLGRNVFYQLVELAEQVQHQGEPWLAVRSDGEQFLVGPLG